MPDQVVAQLAPAGVRLPAPLAAGHALLPGALMPVFGSAIALDTLNAAALVRFTLSCTCTLWLLAA